MARRVKIKRYRHLYRRSRFSAGKALVAVVVVAVAVFLGLSLYEPVRDFVTGKLYERLNSPSSEEEPPAPEPSSSSEAPSEPEPVLLDLRQLRAVSVPQRALRGDALDDFVQRTGLQGINAVMIDLKDDSGRVLYRTGVDLAYEANAVGEDAPELTELVRAAHEAGYRVIGRLCAFRDPLAPMAQDKIAGVKYQDTQLNWLDDDVDSGGRPWLNPYAPVARGYVTDLALEAVKSGVDVLLLDAVHFPEGQGLNLATFGDWDQDTPRDEELALFVSELRDQVEEASGRLVCAVSGADLLAGESEKYGGGDPARLFGGALCARVTPALFGEAGGAGGIGLSSPVLDPFGTVSQVTRQVIERGSGVTEWVFVVQGYTDDEISDEYNKTYTMEDVEEQIRAVDESGVKAGVIVAY